MMNNFLAIVSPYETVTNAANGIFKIIKAKLTKTEQGIYLNLTFLKISKQFFPTGMKISNLQFTVE